MNPSLLSNINAFLQSDKKIFAVKGKAGTGKTQIIKELEQYLNRQQLMTVVAAPTNKAASVLRSRGIQAITIHKALFKSTVKVDANMKPIVIIKPVALHHPTDKNEFLRDSEGNIKYENREEKVFTYEFNEEQLRRHNALLHKLTSRKIKLCDNTEIEITDRDKLLSVLKQSFVLIVDESSMINYRTWKNLFENTSFKIIAVGDTNQLDPVETKISDLNKLIENYDTDADNEFTPTELYDQLMVEQKDNTEYGMYFARLNADWTCTKNHRTKSSNIASVFESVLTDGYSRYPVPLYYPDAIITMLSDHNDAMIDQFLLTHDVVIAWKNATVEQLNLRVRKLKKPNLKYGSAYAPMYEPGEPLYVRSPFTSIDPDSEDNTNNVSITKGEIIRIITPVEEYNNRSDFLRGILYVQVQLDSTGEIFEVPLSLAGLGHYNRSGQKMPSVCHVDFGYAITCNKAQGSQWDNVLVWDDFGLPGSAKKKWRYTAITRTAKNLAILVKNN